VPHFGFAGAGGVCDERMVHANRSESDVVMSTRVRIARNFNGIPFPSKMKREDGKLVIKRLRKQFSEEVPLQIISDL